MESAFLFASQGRPELRRKPHEKEEAGSKQGAVSDPPVSTAQHHTGEQADQDQPTASLAGKGNSASMSDLDKEDVVEQPTQIVTATSQATTASNDLLVGRYFYLHRPNAVAKYKCLIPLRPQDTISDALRDRTVVEFPTIYVLEQSPGQLLEPYVTEEEYLQKHESEMPADLPLFNTSTDDEVEPLLAETIDESKVLEVLQQDLKS